jgi:integrase
VELKKWKLQCPKGEHDLVFPNGEGKPENHANLLKRGFYPALRRAKLRHVNFHTLRHIFASFMLEANVNLKYLQSQLGHSSIKTTLDIYGHLIRATNNQAAEKMADLMFQRSNVASFKSSWSSIIYFTSPYES